MHTKCSTLSFGAAGWDSIESMGPQLAYTNGPNAQPVIHVPTLIPPPAYAHVCPYIFRSADPSIQPESFGFLDTLGLKSIVLLSIEYPSKQLEVYCAKNHIEIHHFGIERRWPSPNNLESSSSASSHLFFLSQEINSFSVLESIVKDALELLLDVRNHPVLVTDMYVHIGSLQCWYFWDWDTSWLFAKNPRLESQQYSVWISVFCRVIGPQC